MPKSPPRVLLLGKQCAKRKGRGRSSIRLVRRIIRRRREVVRLQKMKGRWQQRRRLTIQSGYHWVIRFIMMAAEWPLFQAQLFDKNFSVCVCKPCQSTCSADWFRNLASSTNFSWLQTPKVIPNVFACKRGAGRFATATRVGFGVHSCSHW